MWFSVFLWVIMAASGVVAGILADNLINFCGWLVIVMCKFI